MEKFREYSFLLLRYHCERSQYGRGEGPEVSPVNPGWNMDLSEQ